MKAGLVRNVEMNCAAIVKAVEGTELLRTLYSRMAVTTLGALDRGMPAAERILEKASLDGGEDGDL